MANHLQKELAQLLQREIEYIYNLMRSLDQENAALAEYHTSTLEDATQNKQEIIKELEAIGQQRETLLTAMGISTSSNPNGDVRDSFKTNKQLTALWNDLVSLAEQCQKKNRINGSILDLVSQQSSHALGILRGITPGDELYDYSGQTRQPVETHSLTKA